MITKSSRSAILLVVAWLSASQTSVFADPQADQQTASQAFKLSAMYTAKPSLSRNDVDPSAVQGTLPLPQNQPNQIANLPPTAAAATGNAQQPLPDKGYLQEYNVDWSRWISAEADRWYYTLKSTEMFLGMRFTTVRPAMIEFTCYADGTIGNVSLKQSSGIPIYDRLQIEALLATMPTPPFPAGTQRTRVTLCQGWESHPQRPGESDFQPGSFGKSYPKERVRQWCVGGD